jgi:adenosylmethionine-8-amino-7-oxononanoate aminotransferase
VSIAVALDDLAGVLADRPLVYLVTTDGTRAKVVQVHPHMVDALVHMEVGAGSLVRVATHPDVVLVAPPVTVDPGSLTLLIDAVVHAVEEQHLVLRPTSAVLHRRAAP